MAPFAKQGDPTLKLLRLLQEPQLESSTTQIAVDAWINGQLRAGTQVRDVLSVVKFLKRQLPQALHIHFQQAPIPSTSLLRLPSLLPSPAPLLTKKALMQAVTKGPDLKYITADQAFEVLLSYAWGKLKREGDGDTFESVERVAKKILEIQAELQSIPSIPFAVQSALGRLRYDVGFVLLKDLVSHTHALALSDSDITKPRQWLAAWLKIRLGRPASRGVELHVAEARIRIRTELNQVRSKLPVAVRPVLDSLGRRHELGLSSQRSTPHLRAPHLLLDQRRPSLPIVTTSEKLDAQRLQPAAASTTDVASYLRNRRFGSHPGSSSISLNSIPHYTASQSSSPDASETSVEPWGHRGSPISIKRALRLPQYHDPMPMPSPLPSPMTSHRSSPLSLRHALTLPPLQEPTLPPSLAPPPRSTSSPRTSPRPALRLLVDPAALSTDTHAPTSAICPSFVPSSNSPMSFKRALELRVDKQPVSDQSLLTTEKPSRSSTPKQSSSQSHGSPVSFKHALEIRDKHRPGAEQYCSVPEKNPASSAARPSTPKDSLSLQSHGSPISFKRALELREKHEPMPELSHPFAGRDRSLSLYMPQQQERILAPVETHRPPSVVSSHAEAEPSPTSTARIEFATREFASEARAFEFELPPSRRPSEASIKSHLDMGDDCYVAEPRRSRTLRRKPHRRPSAEEREGLLELSWTIEHRFNSRLQSGTLPPSSTGGMSSSPPRSPESCYSQTSYLPPAKRLAPTTLASIPSSPLFTDDFGQTAGIPSPTYQFPCPPARDGSLRGGRKLGAILPKITFRSRLASLDSNAHRVASGIKSFDQAQRDAFVLGDVAHGETFARQSEESIRTLERIITPYFLPPSTPIRTSSLQALDEGSSTEPSATATTSSTLAPVFELFASAQSADRPSPRKVQNVLSAFVSGEKATADAKIQPWEAEKHRILWIVNEASRVFHEAPYQVVFDHVRYMIEHPQKISASPEAGPVPSPFLASHSRRRPAKAPTKTSSHLEPASPAHTFGRTSYETPRRPSLVPRRSNRSNDSMSTDWSQAGSAPGTPSSVRTRQLSEFEVSVTRPVLVVHTSSPELDRITERSTLSSHDGHGAAGSPEAAEPPRMRTRSGPLPGRWSSDSTIGVTGKEAPPSYWDAMTPIDSD